MAVFRERRRRRPKSSEEAILYTGLARLFSGLAGSCAKRLRPWARICNARMWGKRVFAQSFLDPAHRRRYRQLRSLRKVLVGCSRFLILSTSHRPKPQVMISDASQARKPPWADFAPWRVLQRGTLRFAHNLLKRGVFRAAMEEPQQAPPRILASMQRRALCEVCRQASLSTRGSLLQTSC